MATKNTNKRSNGKVTVKVLTSRVEWFNTKDEAEKRVDEATAKGDKGVRAYVISQPGQDDRFAVSKHPHAIAWELTQEKAIEIKSTKRQTVGMGLVKKLAMLDEDAIAALMEQVAKQRNEDTEALTEK